MENQELLLSSTNSVSASKESESNFCFFCCKSFILDNQQGQISHQTDTEQRFLKFIDRQFQWVKTSTKQDDNSKEKDSPLTCPDCFIVIESYCKLYHQIKCLELQLSWKVEKIRKLMKLADRVPTRVKAFRDWCNAGGDISGGVTIKTEPGVTPVAKETFFTKRQRFKRKCRRYRLKRMPRVVISSTDPNEKTKNNQKNYCSHFLDTSETETSSTITSIASSFCSDVVTQKDEDRHDDDVKGKEYFYGWITSFVTVVFLYHLEMVNVKPETVVSESGNATKPEYEQASIIINSQEEDHSITVDEGVYPVVVKQEIPFDDEHYFNEIKENEIRFPGENSCSSVQISDSVNAEEIVDEISNDDDETVSGKVFIEEEYPDALAECSSLIGPNAVVTLAAPEETDDDFVPVIKSATTLTQECPKTESLIPFNTARYCPKQRSQTDISKQMESMIKSMLISKLANGKRDSKKRKLNTSLAVSPQLFPIRHPESGSEKRKPSAYTHDFDSALQKTIVSVLDESPSPDIPEEKPIRSLRKIFKCEKCLATFSSSERQKSHMATCSTSDVDENDDDDNIDNNENGEDEEDVLYELKHESTPSPKQMSESAGGFVPVIKSTSTLTQEYSRAESVIPLKPFLGGPKKRSQADFSNQMESMIKSMLVPSLENDSKKPTMPPRFPIVHNPESGSVKRKRLGTYDFDSSTLQNTIVSKLESPPDIPEEKPIRSLRKIFKCEKCFATFSSSERQKTHMATCSTSDVEENDEDDNIEGEDGEDVWVEHESTPSPEQMSETDDEDYKDPSYPRPPSQQKKTNVERIMPAQPNIKTPVCYRLLDSRDSCVQCSKKFNGPFQTVCHMWRVHRQCTNVNNHNFQDIVISTGADHLLTVDDIVYDRKGKFLCTECGRGFTEGVDLIHHSKLHGNFKCKFCNEKRDFASKLALHELMHRKSNEEKSSFSCVRCSFTSELIETYVAHHVESHLGLMMDAKRCPTCKYPYKFKQFPDLRIAIIMHYADYHDLTSDKCTEKVMSAKTVQWCMNYECKAFFRTAAQLQDHVQMIHKNIISKVKSGRKQQQVCGRPSSSSGSGEILVNSQKSVIQQACSTTITPSSSSSEKDSKFQCNFNNCGKLHERQIDLDVHVLQVHLKNMQQMPECPKKCGQRFSSELLKDIHLKTHHGEDPHAVVGNCKFSCSVCNKKLISKRLLEKHMMSHSQEKKIPTKKSRSSSSSGISTMSSASLNVQSDDTDNVKIECSVNPILCYQADDEPMVDASLQSLNDESSFDMDPLSLEEDNYQMGTDQQFGETDTPPSVKTEISDAVGQHLLSFDIGMHGSCTG